MHQQPHEQTQGNRLRILLSGRHVKSRKNTNALQSRFVQRIVRVILSTVSTFGWFAFSLFGFRDLLEQGLVRVAPCVFVVTVAVLLHIVVHPISVGLQDFPQVLQCYVVTLDFFSVSIDVG